MGKAARKLRNANRIATKAGHTGRITNQCSTALTGTLGELRTRTLSTTTRP
jgi:hypothetical protein